MPLQPQSSDLASRPERPAPLPFAEPALKPPLALQPLAAKPPLILLRDTERSLRLKTVDAIAPLLPATLAHNLGEASITAETTLDQLAEIDLDAITAQDLQPARIQVGLLFIGFGALMMMFLLLYLGSIHPGLSPTQQLRQFWFQYLWFVCLGVAGLFMLGREAMRE